MLKLIKNNLPFLGVYLLFIISISTLLFFNGKIESQIIANNYYSNITDYLFFYSTKIVEAFLLVIIVLTLLFKNPKSAIIGVLLIGLLAGFVFLAKFYIFPDANRPTAIIDSLRLIPSSFDLYQLKEHSFPSGHTGAAFTIFLFLSIIIKSKRWGFLMGIFAVIVAYSRIYLSQHFFEDLLVGSTIGVLTSLIFFYLLDKIKFGKWAEKPIIKLKK